MDYGMPTLIELESLGETAKLCRNLGLQFIELNMNLPMYQIDRLENTDAFLAVKEAYGVYFTIHIDENLNVCDFNRAVAGAYTDTVLRTIEAAKKIGAPILNLHMNHGVYFTLPDKKVYLFEQYYQDYISSWNTFMGLCKTAAGSDDVRLCIENTDGYRDFEREAIVHLLSDDLFCLTWDIGHSHSVGNTDEPFIMSHRSKLIHFHIHDGLGKQNHMTLGAGEIDLRQRLRLAGQCHGRCVIEVKTADALRDSVQWLKENRLLT